MKKIVILFIIIVIAIVSGLYGFFTFKYDNIAIEKSNSEFNYCLNKEIYGAELATIINKAMENNEKYSIEKDNKGFYIDNDNTSIKIQIKIIDNNTTYDMETFYMNGIDKFVQNYNIIKFKCSDIKYHPITKRVSNLYFEQLNT